MIDVQEYLKGFFKGTKEPSLRAMKYFMNMYGDFEKDMKFIHIAGTNGKGSCTEMISNILIKQGYKVGKFISPHLIRYNERISINNIEITDQDMEKLIEELKPLIDKYNKEEGVNFTLFELETSMALLYFYRNGVDFAVLETGLGGRYDCTNIITKPIVSIITSIGYDHMHLLGDTLPKIAYEKAGVIKENSNTVIYEQTPEVDNVFIETCSEKNNKLHIVKDNNISNYRFDEKYQYFDYKDIKNISVNLKGKVQIKNASLCIEAINILNQNGYKVNENSIKDGLKTVVHRARMEELNDRPKIIYDGAHNEPAIKNLQNMINMYYKDNKRKYIISILNAKDYKKILKLLSEDKKATFVVTSGNDIERYVSKDELYGVMKEYVEEERIEKKEIEEAIVDVMNTVNDTVNLVVGSFYTYENVINKIEELKNKDNL